MDQENIDWNKWSIHLIKEIERLDMSCNSLRNEVSSINARLAKGDAEFIGRKECNDVHVDYNKNMSKIWAELASIKTTLSTQAGTWGVVAGVVGTIIVLILKKAMGW